ncbi:uncharacterized protein PITG_17412 [Phytophthora infestans T30-4]|uniref:Uncharacterized protein n=1 Tax=Phytophthora infestans (strain T30-4) TaxID=403677 RepID=D0NW08_PHYIT|nr:uncharacterized protein PITG_17412 [Phytophthora infestans T30-4]EEY66844.1 conserved hypothetical protein [Phytophthora infestans T30-4]|eukprot:XP_002896731.1 conserved hypothetical protein [Phytophthora infestans T30-4]
MQEKASETGITKAKESVSSRKKKAGQEPATKIEPVDQEVIFLSKSRKVEASEDLSAQSNSSVSKAPARKSLSDGTAIKETTRRTRKPKMAGMHKSVAICMDKVVTEAGHDNVHRQIQRKNATKKAKGGAKGSAKGTQRAMWEDTINVFQQRALMENAWGDDEPRNVTVKQFKNKLDGVRAGYKAKRGRMLATGNCPLNANASSDEGEDTFRKYPEILADCFFGEHDEASDDSAAESGGRRRKFTSNPTSVHPIYRKELGSDLAALWPLLCDVFSHRPGCTGEAFVETGVPDRVSLPPSESDEDERAGDDNADSDSYKSPTKAREKAKATAKAKKQRDKQYSNFATKRPADVLAFDPNPR